MPELDAGINTPADVNKIKFNRKPPRLVPEVPAGLVVGTLFSVATGTPFKPDEEKLIYAFSIKGFDPETDGTLEVFGNPNGSMGEFKGTKSINLRVVEAFGLTPEDVEEQGLSPTDFVGKKCQLLVQLTKKGDRSYPKITALLPLAA